MAAHAAGAGPVSGKRGWCPDLFAPMMSGDGLLLRIKPRLARLPATAAIALAQLSLQHGNGRIEVTNRGNLQFRGFTDASAELFADAALSLGLADADHAAEKRRNILVSPLAGDDPACAADTVAIARTLQAALSDPAFAHLPDKFGLLVDGGGLLPLHDVTADIALRAGPDGWRVEAGGAVLRCTAPQAAGIALQLALLTPPGRRLSRDPADGMSLFAAAGHAAMPMTRQAAPADGISWPPDHDRATALGRSTSGRFDQDPAAPGHIRCAAPGLNSPSQRSTAVLHGDPSIASGHGPSARPGRKASVPSGQDASASPDHELAGQPGHDASVPPDYDPSAQPGRNASVAHDLSAARCGNPCAPFDARPPELFASVSPAPADDLPLAPPQDMQRVLRDLASSAPSGGDAERSAVPPVAVGPIGRSLFGIGAPPGQFDATSLRMVAELGARVGDGVLRVTPFRSIVLGGLDLTGLRAVRSLLSDRLIDPADPRLRTASCIGRPGCMHASVAAPADAARLAPSVPVGALLHVSGCAKGCGHPGAAPIVLVGRDGRYDLVRDGRAGDAPVLRGIAPADAAGVIGSLT